MTAKRPIVLVGRRAPAIAAAKRLGFAPVVLDHKPSALHTQTGYGGSLDVALAQSNAALNGLTPAAVVATAEGAVPAAAFLCERFGVHGIDLRVAQTCADKQRMKRAMEAAGVPCARAVSIPAPGDGDADGADAPGGERAGRSAHESAERVADRVIRALGLPVVLKQPMSSGGRGVRVAHTRDEVIAGLAPPVLAEEFVTGVEMSVETLMYESRTLFRNYTRYLAPRWANVLPARLPDAQREAVDDLVDRALAALGVTRGITHVELFLTERGPLFSEIAARPPGGRIMELIDLAYGFDPWEAVLRIALGDVSDAAPLPDDARRAAGVWMLHPGEGQVAAVRGVDAARAAPGVVRVRCVATPGQRVAERVGTGQSVGEVVVVADTPEQCAAQLTAARALIEIELAPDGDAAPNA